jgi:DNA end-binding protein Ku
MVKGYEFARDQYVLFSTDELKALEQKADNTIEIVEFVPFEKVDRVYVDKPYYLGPDKGGDRAYRLLARRCGRRVCRRSAATPRAASSTWCC